MPFYYHFKTTEFLALADVMQQLYLFSLIGFLLAEKLKSNSKLFFLIGAVLATIIEIGQLFLPGRVADISDIIIGGFGMIVGMKISVNIQRAI